VAVPVVVSTTPVNGATDFGVTESIVFEFNTPLLPASVDPATMVLYRDDTGEPVESGIQLSSDRKTVVVTPNVGLVEEVLYVVAAIGSADNMPGGNIKSADGDDLVNTYQVQFRTARELYERLTQVEDRSGVERVGPIRVDPDDEVTGYLGIEDTSPRGFASDVDRTLSEICVLFDQQVHQTGSLNALEITTRNVLGIEEYYGEGTPPTQADPSGRYLQDCLALDDPRQALFAVEPSGYIVFNGDQVCWVKYSGSPDFHYNTEVIVLVRKDAIVSATGQFLEEDVMFTFTTEYWPLYIGVEYIRLKLGSLICDWFDDTIRRHIHEASIDAVQQAGCAFDPEQPYPAVRRYVRAKVICDILGELSALQGLQGGSKRLGDLEIRNYPTELAKVSAMYQNCQKEQDKALVELRAYRRQSVPTWVVKGSTNPNERRDYRMRTWQGLRFSRRIGANLQGDRQVKSVLAFDHPSRPRDVMFLGYREDERLEGHAFPWW
jgi:hypothetical protein